jgi:hypothetical protein
MLYNVINIPTDQVFKELDEDALNLTSFLVGQTVENGSYVTERAELVTKFSGCMIYDGLIKQIDPPTQNIHSATIVIKYPNLLSRILLKIHGAVPSASLETMIEE